MLYCFPLMMLLFTLSMARPKCSGLTIRSRKARKVHSNLGNNAVCHLWLGFDWSIDIRLVDFEELSVETVFDVGSINRHRRDMKPAERQCMRRLVLASVYVIHQLKVMGISLRLPIKIPGKPGIDESWTTAWFTNPWLALQTCCYVALNGR